MFSRFGKIEEETSLQDLDSLEAQMEADMEAGFALESAFAPQGIFFRADAPQQSVTANNVSPFTPRMQRGRNGAPVVRSAFFPGQVSSNLLPGKQPGVSHLLGPQSSFPRQRLGAPANDTVFGVTSSKFLQPPKSKNGLRQTVEALAALGILPLQLLQEIGFLRYAKEHRFNSLLRLEKALAEGHEDAEQFVRTNPKALKKDTFKPV